VIHSYHCIKIAIIPLVLASSSCATIFNGKNQKLQISHSGDITRIALDSAQVKSELSDNTVIVPRSPEPLRLIVFTDSSTKHIQIPAGYSPALWLNIPFNYGLGILTDLKTNEGYRYQGTIYVEKKNGALIVSKYPPTKAGTIQFSLLCAYANFFKIRTPFGKKNSFGFWGIELGMDYFHRADRYISFNSGIATGFLLPSSSVRTVDQETALTNYFNARLHHVYGRLDYGYGFNISTLIWHRTTGRNSVYEPSSRTNTGLGLSLATQFRLGRFFKVGLLYQPNLCALEMSPNFDYQHFISLTFGWKFPIPI
jgi:hypothetical protein